MKSDHVAINDFLSTASRLVTFINNDRKVDKEIIQNMIHKLVTSW